MLQCRMVLSMAVSCVLAMVSGQVVAQEQPTQPPAGPGAGQQRQQFDPAQMRQRALQRLQATLNVSDDEWQLLQPRIEEVMRLSFEQAGGSGLRTMAGGRGRNGGAAGSSTGRSPGPAAQSAQELATVLRDESAQPADIKDKLTAYRAAREESREELARARESLRELVTQRQEALLVLMGLLD